MQIVRGKCINISNEGKGVVKVNDNVYFVDGLFLDEEADIEVLYSRAGVNFGKVKKLYSISPNRIEPKCKVCTICGGCQYQQIHYQTQLEYKRNRVIEALKHIGKITHAVEPCVGMEDPYFYRNKIQVPFGVDKKGNVVFGFFKENSHQIIPVKQCGIENEKAASILWDIKELVHEFKIPIYNEDTGKGILRHVLIRTSYHYADLMVVLVVSTLNFPGQKNFVKELVKRHPEITTIVENVNSRHTNVILGEKETTLYGNGYIKDSIFGLSFEISASSFYQINPVQVEKLYSLALDFVEPNDTVLDAYSGVGTIGLIASKKAKKVISVEINKDAHKDAKKNAIRNNINNVDFYCDDASKFIANYEGNFDVVIMDPPRKGSDDVFINAVIKSKAKKIIYISCCPETLARDLFKFSKFYEIQKIIPVDMFPFTSHCETFTLLFLKR